jgi:dihydroorotate dehydrogenase
VRALHEAGFAGVDVGSVLRDPQEGNAKPRAFMIGPGVSLNRYGFNSEGIKGVGNHMEAYRDEDDLRMGINIGLNKTVMQTSPQSAPEAYASVASVLLPFASMITVNPSSPNTPGLRALQDRGPLTDIVQAVVGTVRSARSNVPIGVKVSADLSLTALDEVVDVAQQHGAQFLVAANTTTRPDLKRKYGERWENEPGGLSGNDPEFRMMSTEMIKHIHRTTLGRMAVIGVGGVHDTQTAMEKIWAGAGLVQVVTGVREKGIGVAGQINRGILRWMRRTGVSSLEQIRGLDAAR